MSSLEELFQYKKLFGGHNKFVHRGLSVQWGSEYWTSLAFEWPKVF